MQFLGPVQAAARNCLTFAKKARSASGAWELLKFKVECDEDCEVFVNKDKNGADKARELHARKMGEVLETFLRSVDRSDNVHVARFIGTVKINWVKAVRFKTSHTPNEVKVDWNELWIDKMQTYKDQHGKQIVVDKEALLADYQSALDMPSNKERWG